MKLSDFDYKLPKKLIAQFPLKERQNSRLMVVDRISGKISHRHFSDILEYFKPKDSLVLNDTKVIPARIFGRRATGAKVEILLLKKKNSDTFSCLFKPARLKLNEPIIFNGNSVAPLENFSASCGTSLTGLSAKLIHRGNNSNLIRFEAKEDVANLIRRLGVMPLPPYIRREAIDSDRDTYQTVYASKEGAIAAPTAGLHFTKGLIDNIKERKVNVASLTLHVGWGTFRPLKSEDITTHKMSQEEFALPQEAADLVNRTKQQGSKVFAVGTTSTRVLETAAARLGEGAELRAMNGETNLFIYPGFKFKIVDCLLTNFHLPRSTLFLLVCAFAGRDKIFKAYRQAIEKQYRFYSYGDAMLII